MATKTPRTRVVTQNVNFGLNQVAWNRMIDRLLLDCDVLLLQEVKWADLDSIPDTDEWTVHQEESEREGPRGTAVIYRTSIGTYVTSGLWSQIPHRPGVKMEDRNLAYVVLRLTGDWVDTAFASTHNAPYRFRHLWGEGDANIATFVAWCRAEGHRFVIGGDWNRRFGGTNELLAQALRLKTRGIRIDGFYISRSLRASAPIALPANRSDHDPVGVLVWRRYLTRRLWRIAKAARERATRR